MLTLARRLGERLCIGDDIVVQVVDVEGQQVRLGIEAPKEVQIWREEILPAEGETGSDSSALASGDPPQS